ncbi:hypothetical protein E1200_22435 [Actinomadura sp. GC306]|uniref:hypothetical protein n=1 Tax=Actinomadura sp. GC306 TaxID=2530367 RepID=UPI00104C7A24|nr:hypothetical protein [Actinomadura sp. GC306]TDC63399.1 hypothetical protein E1200_22435 [Actinomadura sp. GC306]
MGEFFDVAFGFPTALFTFSLLVVAGYWAFVLVGGLDIDLLGAGADADAGAGAGPEDPDGPGPGWFAFLGLGGVPGTVVLSLLIALAWFVSLAGSALLTGTGPRVLVLAGALIAAWAGTRLAVLPLRRLLRRPVEASLRQFVGLPCVIRTGRVGPDFGQAEVTAPDGSSALVQVRRPPMDVAAAEDGAEDLALTAGTTALIFDFDPAGQFFWVMPHDTALDRPAL